MTRISIAAGCAALGASLVTGFSAGSSVPYLRSVGVQARHVTAVFTLGELSPGELVVASKPETQSNGAFVPANVRLREQMRPSPVRAGFRWRARHKLRPGRYYVQVSGIVVQVDCTPRRPCPTDWSNVRRVRVR